MPDDKQKDVEIKLILSDAYKKQIFWAKSKRSAYFILIYAAPLWFIGSKFGLYVEIISVSMFLLGAFMEDILDFLTDKF